MTSDKNDDGFAQNQQNTGQPQMGSDWAAPIEDENFEPPPETNSGGEEFVGLSKEQRRINREKRIARARAIEQKMVMDRVQHRTGRGARGFRIGEPHDGEVLGKTDPRVFFFLVVVAIIGLIVVSQNPQWLESVPSGNQDSVQVEGAAPAQGEAPVQEPAPINPKY